MNDVSGASHAPAAPGAPEPSAAAPAAATAATASDHFIPVRKTDVLAALLAHGALGEADREPFRRLCRLLAAVCHYDYLDQIEKLRDAYFYFNPELTPPESFDATRERAYLELLAAMDKALTDANFVEVSHAEVERAHRERPTLRVSIKVPLEDYRDVRFFRRGQHQETLMVRKGWKLRKTAVPTDVYDDVILVVAIKPLSQLPEKEAKRLIKSKIKPGSILIKYFRNVARSDLGTLFPNVRVIMSLRDKFMLGIPALFGGVPIVLKLASTVTVLFAVTGFYLGLRGAVEDNEVETAIAALSGLVALGLFMLRQWVSYQRQSLQYQKKLADNFYFRNVNNNAGVFDSIAGMAEDQECKEALLSYYFLLITKRPLDQAALKAQIEAWMKSALGVTIAFEVDDALAKLDQLGLLRREGESLSVLPLQQAFARLDGVWDGYFGADARV